MVGFSICHGECFSRAGGLPCWLALVSALRGRFPEGESSLVDDFSSRAFRFSSPTASAAWPTGTADRRCGEHYECGGGDVAWAGTRLLLHHFLLDPLGEQTPAA